MKKVTAVGLLLAMVVLAGCGSAKEGFEDGKNASGNKPSNDGTLQITKADFGEGWPFTVDDGLLSCRVVAGASASEPEQAIVFGPGDTAYAVNGTAKSRAAEQGWKPVDEVWADNPATPGTKKDLGPVINRGLSICK